jgi:ribosomal protein L44E
MVWKVCCERGCGRLVDPAEAATYRRSGRGGTRCAEHAVAWQAADDRRRRARQQASGRNTKRWRQLLKQAKQAAGYRCQECGAAEVPELNRWLGGHLRPELRGDHTHATLADVRILCASCHARQTNANTRR